MSNLSKTNIKSLIVIDSRVTDWQSLIGDDNQNATLLVLDSARDGLTQIAEAVANASNIDAIHIISHGNIGSLLLGSTTLDSSNLSDYQTQLTTIGNALSTDGDILLYGCDVAQGDVGVQFINTLAQYTGADVAASDDLTGSAALGGDWILEVSTGNIEAKIESIPSYSSVLQDYAWDYQLAEMATLAYQYNPSVPDKPSDLNIWNSLSNQGWSYIDHSFGTSGFGFAGFEFKQDNKIVIAYRGTDQLTDLNGDVAADAAIANSSSAWHQQFTDALNFAWNIKTANPGATIYVTGHSLGGALAQVVSNTFQFDGATFDPGGAANIVGSPSFPSSNYNDWIANSDHNVTTQGVGAGFLNYVVDNSLVSGLSGDHIGNKEVLNYFHAYATDTSFIIKNPILGIELISYSLATYNLLAAPSLLTFGVATYLNLTVLHSMDNILSLMRTKMDNQLPSELQQQVEQSLQLAGTTGDIGFSSSSSGQSQIEFHSSQFNPYILTNDLDNIIYGYAGNDAIYSLAGNDTVYAGNGDDIISTAQGNDVIDAGAGSDTVYAGSGNDTIALLANYSEPDVVSGGMGTDSLSIDFSANQYDALYWRGYDASGTATSWLSVGSNISAIQTVLNNAVKLYVAASQAYYGVTFDSIENLSLTASSVVSSDDLLILQGNGSYDGKGGTDAIYADWSSATSAITISNIDPTTAQDFNGSTIINIERWLVQTGSGDDVITTATGSYNDEIDSGAGNDTINAKAGSDVVRGGSGNDTIALLANYSEPDVVSGGTGTDSLSIDFSANQYDALYWRGYDASGTATSWLSVGSNISAIQTVLNNAVKLYVAASQAYYGVTFDSIENLSLTASSVVSSDDLLILQGNGSYDGKGGTDAIYADWSSATSAITISNIDPTTAQDFNGSTIINIERWLVQTGSGDDVITAYSNNDEIDSGAGNDTINAGAGNDRIWGGNGIDTAIFSGAYSDYQIDTIAGGMRVTSHLLGGDGIDELYEIEYLQFSDQIVGFNHAPTDLTISKNNINENVAVNSVVGTLSSTDPDVPLTPNTFTYSFVTDPIAGVDNSAFTIVGDKLEINSSPDFETKSSYSINVRTTDQGNLSFDKPLNITINNVNEHLTLGIPATVNYTDTPVVDDFTNQIGTHQTGLLVGTPDLNMASIPLIYGIASTVGVTVTDNLDGTVSGSSTYGTLTVTKATGAYSFIPNNSAIEPLGAPATSSLTVTVTDGLLNASQTFTVAIAQSGITETNGNDSLTGTTGNDTINGLAGADTMAGGLGNDTYYVDNLGDVVIENASVGNDIIYASVSYTLPANVEALVLLTGAGNINGYANSQSIGNSLTGNEGNNILVGGAGNDVINGLVGNDTLDGGVSDVYNPGVIDKLNGGAGDDSFLVRGFFGAGVYDGGTGIDTLDFSPADTYTAGRRSAEGAGVNVDLSTGKATTYYLSATNFTWSDANGQIAVSSIENVIGTDQGDRLSGDANANSLVGGAGNDTLMGVGSNDTLVGGTGNDTYIIDSLTYVLVEAANAGSDTVQASINFNLNTVTAIENLTLTGTASTGTGDGFDNSLIGNSLSNTLNGGGGNDTLDGGVSDVYNPGVIDTLNGEAGNDTFLVHGFFGAGVYDGGVGTDTLDFSQADTYTAGRRSVEGAGIKVDLAATISNGIAFTYYNASTNFTWTDASGQIQLFNIENVRGSSQSDLISGDGNANTLDGGVSDVYNPGVIDKLNGGAGDDSFLVRGFFGAGVYDGGVGTDTLDFSPADTYTAGRRSAEGAGVNVDLSTGKASTYYLSASNYTWADANGQLALTGIENVIGTDQGDRLSGDANANSLVGGAGNDTLIGVGSNDTLVGGTGNDTYIIDSLTYVLVEAANAGSDTVQASINFNLNTVTAIENLTLTGTASTGTGDGFDNSLIGNSLSNTLNGGGGNDTLDGGVSDVYNLGVIDTLNGEAGNDTFLVHGFFGAGVYDGGVGTDTLDFSQSDTYTAGRRSVEDAGIKVDLAATISNGIAFTYYNASTNFTWTDASGQIQLFNIENVRGSSQSDLISGDGNANTLDGGVSDVYNPGVIDKLNGGAGDDSFLVRGFFGAGVYDGGVGTDTLDFSQSDTYTAARRSAEGAGVNVDLSTGKASTYYLSASNFTWADANGQIAVSTIENVIGTDQGDRLSGDANANSLVGGAGNDVLVGGENTDTLIGGLGKDTNYLTETTPSTDTVSIATGDSLVTSYDLVYGFGLGTSSISTTGVDNLHLASTVIAANGIGDGTDVGTGVNAISSHSISNGIISFDSLGAYDAPVAITATNLANVFSYLQANIMGGNTVAFVSEGNTFVFQDGGATDTLVELVGVIASSLNTMGLATNAIWIA